MGEKWVKNTFLQKCSGVVWAVIPSLSPGGAESYHDGIYLGFFFLGGLKLGGKILELEMKEKFGIPLLLLPHGWLLLFPGACWMVTVMSC